MEYHRLVLQFFKRTDNSVETLIDSFEKEYQVQTPQQLTRLISSTDNFVDIPIPQNIVFKYVFVISEFNGADTAAGVLEGDPAPIVVRRDNENIDLPLTDGFIALTGSIHQLKVSTPYASTTNKIKVTVFLGG
ncbi:hypothetical protein LEP1GSC050_0098 [Leptospira phage vB_LbrZ_5399-LE1]|uniref:Uncharacterized protein n=1 Tax=Leptospira inadai serovar Lyme TaxID=293084 RepID=A0ABX4YGL6_9LEPT|nr:hypothetical protein [Leptospira inadai]AGS80778.1 hypothetical protein LEP1GSC050_0098 [Leptospira phage vB_LbrZ_5399-LE1]AGS80884.1 hypothetical protein LEP1GSC047_0874 [Leptospira phage vB_LinZ_10-LE1]PNV74356.1 hypothetical protein BES34_014325 [Leptospira inadai serovar Lyme]